MEQKLPILAQRFLDIVRVTMFMLRKGISKIKLLLDLNLMKRGKIAGKAMHNLMFHHNNHRASAALNKRKPRMFSGGGQLAGVMEGDYVTPKMVMKALEMLQSEAAESPALPGFGRTPVVRQLRITDSPFPLNYGENYVDEAAEDFINKFYKDLIKQNNVGV